MTQDLVKLLFTYLLTAFVLASGFYALVLYPYQLDDLVKGAIIGFMASALTWVYGDQVASRTSRQSQRAFDSGLSATPNEQILTATATGGETPTASVTPGG